MKKLILNSQEETLTKIVETSCDITREQIRSKYRYPEYVIPRMILGYLLRHEAGCTVDRAGKLIGRHHCSLIFYEAKFDEYNNSKFHPKFKEAYDKIMAEYICSYPKIKEGLMQDEIERIEEHLNKLKQDKLLLTKNL